MTSKAYEWQAQVARWRCRGIKKLLNACKTDGFFYLNIQSIDDNLLQVVDAMFQLDRELYDVPDEEKMAYDVDKLSELKLNGYKPVGRNFGGLAGQKDGFEMYAIPKDGIMDLDGQGSFVRPPVVDKYMNTLKSFVRFVNTATTAIMERISVSLELPEGVGLLDYHRPNVPSPDIIRLLKYHAQDIRERGALHTPHTDLGSLTFLFTRQPGLQILAPNSNEWTWVEPMEDCVIVNLGDMMALLTNDYLRSCLHRVAPLPGQAMPTRYSFAYLVRAENRTPMTGLNSPLIPVKEQEEVLTSDDWIKKKFGVLRLDSRKEGQDWVLTGQDKVLPV
ncbi:hypothetical protein N7455_010417 [Penicillium solitum]|uniref:uncharacterized protein n=1 Tax=Penicillium solitum TaxID=60172 RepID=UPI0032C41583|nr:hypothetical protein N7455_010417 [Penicillium solitum]